MNYGHGRLYVVGGRWGRPGFRSQNVEHLLSAGCLLPSAMRGSRAGGTLSLCNSLGQNVFSTKESGYRSDFKMKQQCGDVYENKGAAFHGPMESGNVIENKGSTR